MLAGFLIKVPRFYSRYVCLESSGLIEGFSSYLVVNQTYEIFERRPYE
jgi:hypothetical protein